MSTYATYFNIYVAGINVLVAGVDVYVAGDVRVAGPSTYM
jgi:hypothetical protein